MIFLAADHAGFSLKEKIKTKLQGNPNLSLTDVNPELIAGDDYPMVAHQLAHLLLDSLKKTQGKSEPKSNFGLAFCGTGQGICMSLNRYKGIRAGISDNPEVIKLLREHNNANVLCLPGRFMQAVEAENLIQIFLKTKFVKEKRFLRRLEQLDQ